MRKNYILNLALMKIILKKACKMAFFVWKPWKNQFSRAENEWKFKIWYEREKPQVFYVTSKGRFFADENAEFLRRYYAKDMEGVVYYLDEVIIRQRYPNIMFAAACPLTNLTMSGTTKLGSVTLETNRAKDAVTAEDLAYLRESLIANNSMSSVRLFYAGGSSEYIR